ncbi:MAG: hypothetical protein ACRDK5_06240 [Solirubrobacterales bacterium]
MADADVFCVGTSGGDCTSIQPELQTALDAAEASVTDDIVRLGPGTFTAATDAGFTYAPGAGAGDLTVTGAGQGHTTVTAPGPAVPPAMFTTYTLLSLSTPSNVATVSDLTLLMPTPPDQPNMNQLYRGLVSIGNPPAIEGVTITAPALLASGFGMVLSNGGQITDTTVSFDINTVGARLPLATTATTTVEDSSFTSNFGVRFETAAAANELTLRRSTVRADFNAVRLTNSGTVTLESSVIDLGPNGIGLGIDLINSINGTMQVRNASLDGVTIGGSSGAAVGVLARNNDSAAGVNDQTTVTIRNTVFDPGLITPIHSEATQGDLVSVSTDYSNYDPAFVVLAGTGTVSATNQTNLAPGFVDSVAGNFHLLSSSPLLDIGDPAALPPGELDIDGDVRALSALASCSAPDPGRRDIGADEFVAQTLDCISPDTQIAGRKKLRTRKKRARARFTLTSTDPGSSFECSVDSRAFAPCSSPFRTKLRIGRHLLTVRARDVAGNVDATPAMLAVKVKRKT